MDPYRKKTRRQVTDMEDIEEYHRLMARVKLTPIERQVCDLKYLEGQNLAFIGDKLGYSESGIKSIHKRALRKIAKMI